MRNKLLILVAGLLLVLPTLAWTENAIYIESKTVLPGLAGSPAFNVRVDITNDDSLAYMTLALATRSQVGTAYALLNKPGAIYTWAGVVNPLTGTLRFFSAGSFGSYSDASPDAFLVAAGFDGADPATIEPPNAAPKPVWELKFRSSSVAEGEMIIKDTAISGAPYSYFTNTRPVDIRPTTFVNGVLTIQSPACNITNCAGSGGNLLYGRPYSKDFDADQGGLTWSVAVGPGSIDPNTGVYTFSGQCPLGPIPVTVRATNPTNQRFCECSFTLNIIDNAPSCTPAQATVTVSHGALAANQINTSDPDQGDNVSVSQTSGPGTTSPAGAWSYQTSCQDVGASPQTVQEQVVDGFGNCQPGPLSATCQFQLVVTNAPPDITCPPNAANHQAGSHYSGQATASDADPADAGSLVFSLVSGPAGLTVSPSGAVDWDPTAADAGLHVVIIEVRDLCGAVDRCEFTINVVVGQRFQLCIDKVGAEALVTPGSNVEVSIRNLVQAEDPNTSSSEAVGGFSFLLSYDCACLQFLSARKGAMLVNQGWEFFTYRYGAVGNGNCGAGCPSCLVRVVAIADVNNGSGNHPGPNNNNQGEWAGLTFRVANNWNLLGQCCQISWYWFDCTDNTVSDETGNVLWVAEQLLSAAGSPIDLSSAFPTNIANCDQFSGGEGKPSPRKFIIFCNGEICLPDAGELDARADLNLNGQGHEIADLVLYQNYFIYGSGVFTINLAGQTAASDVNGDGYVLTVADLIALSRVITGDAQPLPKTIPADWAVDLAMTSAGSQVTLSANSGTELGGLYLKFHVDGAVGTPELMHAASGMTIKSNLVGNELSVLVYSESKGAKIDANAGAVLRFPVEGNIELVESGASSYYGADLPTVSKVSARPTAFGLSQNYPNPFNGKTSFILALPVASDYTVTVYNVTGQVVRTYQGSAGPGNKTIVWDGNDNNGKAVSSGVYFFKAVAGEFSAVKKGLYLK